MLRSLLLYLSEVEFPKKLLTRFDWGRRLAARFIAGETLEEALVVIHRLRAEGFFITLDHLGENVREAAEAARARDEYLEILDRLAAERLDAHISVKLTQLGLALGEDLARENLRAIAERAAKYRTFVRIDMEGSAYTEATLRIFRALDAPRDVLGVVIQSYLRRSEKDVEELLRFGARIRLCKGAYQEPPEIAFPRKADVDANFVKLMRRMLASGGYHAIATHDRKMTRATILFASSQGISRERFEFQMLYGVRTRLQRELLKRGWRVRIYVPFGSQWYPYFMRRLAERPANLLFLIRNLLRN